MGHPCCCALIVCFLAGTFAEAQKHYEEVAIKSHVDEEYGDEREESSDIGSGIGDGEDGDDDSELSDSNVFLPKGKKSSRGKSSKSDNGSKKGSSKQKPRKKAKSTDENNASFIFEDEDIFGNFDAIVTKTKPLRNAPRHRYASPIICKCLPLFTISVICQIFDPDSISIFLGTFLLSDSV